MNYYTADLHLSHEAVIRMCNRPFSSTSEMNETIIANLQARVTRNDDLWILGDLAFAKQADRPLVHELMARVLGRKHLIRGNHDKGWIWDMPWHSKHDYLEIKDQTRRVVMFHYPMVTWPGARHGALQLFGHVHDNWAGQRNSVNVGVDQWDFRPAHLDDIAARADALPVSQIFKDCEPGMGEG